MEIIPFDASLIAPAGELLAIRHWTDRSTVPELPERFTDAQIAAGAVQAVWQKPGAAGVAALDGSRLLGYMIGHPLIDSIWGRSAWVRLPGCALAADQEGELVRRMYAALAAPWVEAGVFFHFAVIPAGDLLQTQAWFSLSFGIEQVYALQAIQPPDPRRPLAPPPGLTIRRAASGDQPLLRELAPLIWQHQVQAPVWGISLPEARAEILDGYAGLLDDPEVLSVWLALEGERALGMQGYYLNEESDDDLLTSPQTVNMSVAQTRPEARGRGVQAALHAFGLAHAYDHGCRFSLTDWRSANLLASRVWPRLGYRPAAYRLVRRVDQRIAWAS